MQFFLFFGTLHPGEEGEVEVGGPGLHYLCSLPLLQDVITDWEPALTCLPGRDQVSVVEVTIGEN